MVTKKLSLKDRIRIKIRGRKPLKWYVHSLAALILAEGMVISGAYFRIGAESVEPEEFSDQSQQFRFSILGDIDISESVRSLGLLSGYSAILNLLEPYYESSDYVMADLEGPVLSKSVENYTSQKSKKEEVIYARPRAIRGLSESGINIFSFANDNVYNYGRKGIDSTISVMEKYDIEYVGIAKNTEEELYRIVSFDYTDADGNKKTYSAAVFSINDVISENSTVRTERSGVVTSTMDGIYSNIYQVSQQVDLVITYIHAGESMSAEVTDDEQSLAHALVNAGADLVVGSHSHRVQTIESYDNAVIFYGIGDLISDQEYSINQDGAMVDLLVDNDGSISVYATCLRMTEGRARVVDSGLYYKRIVNALTDDLDESAYTITNDGMIKLSLGKLPDTPATKQTSDKEKEKDTENNED